MVEAFGYNEALIDVRKALTDALGEPE